MTTIDVDGHDIELTHPEKVLFPDIGFTKADLADYYRRIAEWMLPHIEGRPLVLQRFPDGIDGPGFIQKAVPDHYPDWIERFTVARRRGGTQTHLVADEPADLVPYTLRPLPGAPVAAPVGWDELGGTFDPHRFTVANIFRRLSQKADPWADYGQQRIAARELAARLD